MAVWWWGRIEAGPGVTLFRSVFENGRWSERAPIKTRAGSASNSAGRSRPSAIPR